MFLIDVDISRSNPINICYQRCSSISFDLTHRSLDVVLQEKEEDEEKKKIFISIYKKNNLYKKIKL